MEKETANSEPYACLFCDSKFKSASSVKGHITRKHRDQMKDGEPEEEEAADDLDENDVARMELLNIEMRNQEGVVEETSSEEEVDTRMVINSDTEQLGSLPEAVERIKVLLEEQSVKEELIKKLETELDTSKILQTWPMQKKKILKLSMRGQVMKSRLLSWITISIEGGSRT